MTSAEAKQRLDTYFTSNSKPVKKFSDQTICEISSLLRILKLPSTSPRLYIVLRSIRHPAALHCFIEKGITDFWFPFQIRSLPTTLDKAVQSAFLGRQWIVLTRSIDLENGAEGVHQYFDPADVIPFESKGRLGEGTYGAVDRVRSTLTGAVYARKRIRRSDTRTMHRNMEMFKKEVLAMKRLQHRHVVKLIGSYTDQMFAAFIISPIADSNLDIFLNATAANPTPHNLSVLRTFFGCLANGLEYMHQQSVRHKDIKPGNILVKDHAPLYTDFGLAFDWAESGRSTTQDTWPAMTRIYSAPELLMDAPRNSATDIWSLGCVFVEIFSVLRCSPVIDLKKFLRENGTKSATYALNADGLNTFLGTCLTSPGLPLEKNVYHWIRSMLKTAPQQRPTAETLRKEIEGISGFTGDCCKASQRSTVPNDEYWFRKPRKNTPSLRALTASKASFFAAVHEGDLLTIRDSLRNGVDINSVDYSGKTAAMMATKNESAAVLSYLLQNGADPGLQDYRGATALHMAIEASNFDAIDLLVDAGADVDKAQKTDMNAPIHLATNSKNAPCVEKLISAGANVNLKQGDGFTPLLMAADYGIVEIVQLLLSAGARTDITTPDKELVALHRGAQNNHHIVVEMLLSSNAIVDARSKDGSTALHIAAANGYTRTVELLLDHGASMENQRGNYGQTPLFNAAYNGHLDTVKLLCNRGAIFTEGGYKTKYGNSALHAAAFGGWEPIVSDLLELGASVDARNDAGETALHMAAGKGNLVATRSLLSHGARVNARDNGGRTVLHLASVFGHFEVTRVLLSCGASVDAQNNNGETALFKAACHGRLKTIRVLLSHGASVNARNNDGKTALHEAARYGRLETTKVLLSFGADSALMTRVGVTPLDIAFSRGDTEIVELLENSLSRTA